MTPSIDVVLSNSLAPDRIELDYDRSLPGASTAGGRISVNFRTALCFIICDSQSLDVLVLPLDAQSLGGLLAIIFVQLWHLSAESHTF